MRKAYNLFSLQVSPQGRFPRPKWAQWKVWTGELQASEWLKVFSSVILWVKHFESNVQKSQSDSDISNRLCQRCHVKSILKALQWKPRCLSDPPGSARKIVYVIRGFRVCRNLCISWDSEAASKDSVYVMNDEWEATASMVFFLLFKTYFKAEKQL